MLSELKEDNLAEIVAANNKVMVQYMASWCGNCRLMKPKFKMLSDEYSNIEFVMADAEQFPESRKLANVNNLPTFAGFVNGKFVNQTQTNRLEVLKELVDEIARS